MESYNPYSKELMKKFLDNNQKNGKVDGAEILLNSQKDVLASLAAVTYARDNGYSIEIKDDFVESSEFKIRHWRASKNGNT